MDTQDRINLGQAKNQALMTLGVLSFFDKDSVDVYKNRVKMIFKANAELDAELLKTGEESKGLNRDVHTPITTKQNSQLSPSLIKDEERFNKLERAEVREARETRFKPSPKQKYCPKCNVIIPKTWKKLIECGWKE